MRVRLVRRKDDSTVLLVYPSTLDEYGEALETLAHPARPAGSSGPDPALAGRRPAHGCYVVTTEELRHRWGLPDLSAHGRARVVDESRALDVLGDAAAWSAAAVELPADAGATPSPAVGERDASKLAAVRALVAHVPRVDRVLAAIECGVLPRLVCETLRHALLQSLGSGKAAVEKALDRAAMAAALPWRTRGPVRFDPAHLKQVLDRTHGGLDRVKTRLVDVLAASPQTRGALTVEAPRRGKGVETESSALVVLPRTPRAAARIPCLCGLRGTGKTSLAVAVADAFGRTQVRVTMDKGNTERLIHGQEGDAPGRILQGLREAGVRNPVFILEAIDRVEPEAADELFDILDPGRCIVFEDHYLQVRFDLSAVLWIATATDPAAIPEAVRNRLEVIELPGYTEHEKLAIAEQYLLKRPFDGNVRVPAACLAPEPAAPSPVLEPDAGPEAPDVVMVERDVSSFEELEALSAAAVSRRRRRRVAHGGVQRRRPLRDRGDPPGDPRPHG